MSKASKGFISGMYRKLLHRSTIRKKKPKNSMEKWAMDRFENRREIRVADKCVKRSSALEAL